MEELNNLPLNTKKINEKEYLPIQLSYIDNSNNILNFNLNGKFFNNINYVINNKILYIKGYRYFLMNKIFNESEKFKNKELANASLFFRDVQNFAIHEGLLHISNQCPYLKQSFVKIGASKDLKKNCCIIDDSTIQEPETNIIRESKGDSLEPHRGYKLFKSLSTLQQQDVVFKLHAMGLEISKILNKIKNNEIVNFDPITILQKIANYCKNNNYEGGINYLAMEVHDKPYSLTQEERNNLFEDYDSLKNLWYSGFITDNHGKFRIYMFCIYFLDNIEKNKVLSK
jgi:hypothetical protein